jgi:uncharacterized protein YceH (UPF0502 family)
MQLSQPAIRVLGALMEKARTTPEVYPLTLNSLVHACNQKTSRDPVTDYDDDDVMAALDELRDKHLAMRVDVAGSRTAKFRENATQNWELSPEEYAVLTVLFLRGAQTPGQIRQRSDRLFQFAELQQVNDRLHEMENREDEPFCLTRCLGKEPGTKEVRWLHTLGGEVLPEEVPKPDTDAQDPVETLAPANLDTRKPTMDEVMEKLDRMEKRLQELESLLNELTS